MKDEKGSITPLVIGFFIMLVMLVAVVVDASAAFLQRQGLNSIADAAALSATDGLQGDQVYTEGLKERAEIDPAAARAYVSAYFSSTGARRKYPGLTYTVATRGTTVLVRVRAPMDLPLRLPGVGEGTVVTGTAASVVVIAD